MFFSPFGPAAVSTEKEGSLAAGGIAACLHKAHRAFQKMVRTSIDGKEEDMLDFKTLCSKYDIDLGDKEEEFTKELLQNYKTVEENERNKEKLARAEAELEESKQDMKRLQEQIEAFSGTTDELAQLKAENEAYKRKEIEAAKIAEQQAINSLIDRQIKEVIGDKKFVNEYVERAFVGELRDAILDEKNAGKTATEIFTEMSDNQAGLFATEQAYAEHPGISEGASSSENFSRENRDIFADLFNQQFN